jgi:hypothetical protein
MKPLSDLVKEIRDEWGDINRPWYSTRVIRILDALEKAREALSVADEYLDWEKKAHENAWCQDGSKQVFARDAVRKALKEMES